MYKILKLFWSNVRNFYRKKASAEMEISLFWQKPLVLKTTLYDAVSIAGKA